MSNLIQPPKLPPNERAYLDASQQGDLPKVAAMLEKGVPVDVRDDDGMPWDQTALMYAAANGHIDLVRLLIDKGANVLAKDKAPPGEGGGRQAIHYAARGKWVEVIAALLKAGANPNALDKEGETPLTKAIANGNVEVARFLLGHGADVNLKPRSKSSMPPLYAAAMAKSPVMVKVLLDAGANVNAVNELDRTALAWAVTAADEIAVSMVANLLQAGAEVDHVDRLGETPLSGAVFHKNFKTVELLARSGANVNRVFESQKGTLLDASERRVEANAKHLVVQGSAAPDEADILAVKNWREMSGLLRKLGAKRQSEL